MRAPLYKANFPLTFKMSLLEHHFDACLLSLFAHAPIYLFIYIFPLLWPRRSCLSQVFAETKTNTARNAPKKPLEYSEDHSLFDSLPSAVRAMRCELVLP